MSMSNVGLFREKFIFLLKNSTFCEFVKFWVKKNYIFVNNNLIKIQMKKKNTPFV